MYSNKYITKMIDKLNSSKFDEKLIKEIANSSMLMCFYEESNRTIKNQKYSIILNDMITSLINMQKDNESIVYTNPFNIFNYSWIYRVYGAQSDKGILFKNSIKNLVDSNVILPNEFPIELKVSIIRNIYSKQFAIDNYKNWTDFVEEVTSGSFNRTMFLVKDIVKSLLIYNDPFIDFSDVNLFETLGLYFLLKRDYTPLIILATRLDSDFLYQLVKIISDNELSISDLFGKGLILQSRENEHD